MKKEVGSKNISFWDKKLKGVSVVSNIILDRACAIRLQTIDGKVFYFISVYMPAAGSSESLVASLDDVTEVIESREPGAIITVMGDFNGDIGFNGGPRGARIATPRGKKIIGFFVRHQLSPLNMQLSASGPVDIYQGQVNGSTLDYIAVSSVLCNQPYECFVSEWDSLNTSDHLPVNAIRTSGILYSEHKTPLKGHVKWNKLTPHDKFLKYQCVLEPLIQESHSEFIDGSMDRSNIDASFQRLTDAILRVSDTLPHSCYKKNLKPFWNKELSSLKLKKVQSYRQWVSAGRPRAADNILFIQYKSNKRIFHRAIKKLSKEYEEKEIFDAVKLSEINRNYFWRLIKTARKSQINGVNAVKRDDDVVVHDIDEVLHVWVKHFSAIGTPKESDAFDKDHFIRVSETVSHLNALKDSDNFLDSHFTCEEVHKAIRTLHLSKAPGFDNITTEHLAYAGPLMVDFLCNLYNAMCDLEYIPICFRWGVQIPLYKGKDTCTLDPKNYRGITLLPTYNKLFEILIWQRLKRWWTDERIISELQGACRSGFSCVHTAFNLRETLATSLESSEHCFVTFYDMAKAFDTVWIDGLFMQMYDLGISGKTWRLLYRCYIDFKCCVKINGTYSDWYEPQCGIHQGFFTSLMKYTVFINSLLVTLKEADISCKIYRTPSTPLGYTDDITTCCVSKFKLDKAMDIVYNHGCVWRYEFNAKKSGVLVYGESPKEHERNSCNRLFKLGPNKVRERTFYDHVGIRNCIFANDVSGIEERIVKGRRAFNSISGIGIRKGGITMATCNLIFWSMVASFG